MLVMLLSAVSVAAITPTASIKALDTKLEQFKVREGGKPLSPEDEAFNQNLKREVISGTFDVKELSRLSLGRHWKERTPQEREAFPKLLSDLLEEKALFSKEQSIQKSKHSGGKYSVSYSGHTFLNAEKTRAFVKTRVSVPSEKITITLNYRMKKAGDGWVIYDVIVDEASLVDNYRYQFNSIIKKHGYPELVSRMSNKLDSIRNKRGPKDASGDAASASAH